MLRCGYRWTPKACRRGSTLHVFHFCPQSGRCLNYTENCFWDYYFNITSN